MGLIWTGVRVYLMLTFVLGLIYPGVITAVARAVFPGHAGGALITRGDRVVGSSLIAQPFREDRYVHPRPSAVNYDALNSGASNQGPISADLRATVAKRRADLAGDFGDHPTPAMLYASASGLDPDLDLASARAQAPRVSRARGITEERVRSIIERSRTPRQFGVLGEPRVNVLRLNLSLDEGR